MRDTIVSIPILKRTVSYFVALRRLLLLVPVLSLVCLDVLAFNAGELKILSSGEQPLKAEILLPRTVQDNTDDIQAVFLAAKTTYAQADLVYADYLDQLTISLVSVGGGSLIEITAPKPPTGKLELLLEFRTSVQQYIQFYTLAGPVSAAAANQDSNIQASDLGASERASQSLVKRSSNNNQSQVDQVHKVEEGDTLWNIAKRLQPEGLTVAETMRRLFEANPDAFQDADITQLKRGSLLKVVSASQAKEPPVELPPQQTVNANTPKVELELEVVQEAVQDIAQEIAPEISQEAETETATESPSERSFSEPSLLDEPASLTLDNEDALEDVLQELAQEFAEEAQSEDASEDPVVTQLPPSESETESTGDNFSQAGLPETPEQPSVEQFVSDQLLEEQPVTEPSAIEQPLVNPNQETGAQLTQLFSQTLSRIEAMLDWHFVHDPIDDYRQLMTWPWLGGGLLALIFIVLLIRALFKSRLKRKNQQAEQSFDALEGGEELSELPTEERVNGRLVIYDDLTEADSTDSMQSWDGTDTMDSTAIYANRDSDFEGDSAKTPQHRKDYPEPPKPSSENETGSSDHAVFFPGIEELDAQMSEGFLVDQRQSGDSQSTANSQDIDHNDPHKVRMDMATICMEMNDNETAREILLEIIHEADEPVRTEAQGMLDSLNDQLSD